MKTMPCLISKERTIYEFPLRAIHKLGVFERRKLFIRLPRGWNLQDYEACELSLCSTKEGKTAILGVLKTKSEVEQE